MRESARENLWIVFAPRGEDRVIHKSHLQTRHFIPTWK